MTEDEKGTAPAPETPSPDEVAPDEAAAAAEEAQESVDDLKERIADLEKRLTKEGRTKASIRQETDQLREQLEEAVKANEEWKKWYLENAASPEEKAAAKKETALKGQDAAKSAQIERDHWRAIAEEENPVVKRALTAAAKKGEFLTVGQISALRETFSDVEEGTKPKPAPPRVSGARATGNQQPSLDDQIVAAIKAKDFDKALQLKTEKARQGAQVS
ncbi:MAG TPA: hypothetical protein VFK94_06400 [Patescibacteria group bacterium]|nr:hypothetical protein [Patescibacteria group bacterium]